MKNSTKMAATVGLVLLGLAVLPTAASADTLPGSDARSKALDMAIDWSLADPDASNFWVDYCTRRSAHKFSCDANISGTHYGSLRCGSYNCYETDTDYVCWKTVMAVLSPHWQAYKVRYRVGQARCSSRTHTEVY